MLEASQALSDLLLRRMEEIAKEGKITPQFPLKNQTYFPFCTISGTNLKIDEAAFTAFIAYLAALSKKQVTAKINTDGSCIIYSDTDTNSLIDRYKLTFSSIAIWGDFEFDISNSIINLRQRQ